MEGAKALQVAAGFLQPQVFRDEVHQVKAILDLLDGILFHLRHGGKLTSHLPSADYGPAEASSKECATQPLPLTCHQRFELGSSTTTAGPSSRVTAVPSPRHSSTGPWSGKLRTF